MGGGVVGGEGHCTMGGGVVGGEGESEGVARVWLRRVVQVQFLMGPPDAVCHKPASGSDSSAADHQVHCCAPCSCRLLLAEGELPVQLL